MILCLDKFSLAEYVYPWYAQVERPQLIKDFSGMMWTEKQALRPNGNNHRGLTVDAEAFQLIKLHRLTKTVEVKCKWVFTHTERVLQLQALMVLPATSAQLAPSSESDCWTALAWSRGVLALQMKRQVAFPGLSLKICMMGRNFHPCSKMNLK